MKIIIERLPDGGFKLSGGPLTFHNKEELTLAMARLSYFPYMRAVQCDHEKTVTSMPSSLTIDDEMLTEVKPGEPVKPGEVQP